MAFYFLAHKKAPKFADEFFRVLIDGTNFEGGKTDPIYQLRENINAFNASYRTKRGRATPMWVVGGMLIKAWNAWMDHGSVRQLRMMTNEKWPEMSSRSTRSRKPAKVAAA